MHRPSSDPEAMDASDFFCDFCGQEYGGDRPMVEGHRGSLICGKCLSSACKQVLVLNAGVVVPEHIACSLCLLNKRGDYWQSPVRASTVPGSEGEKGSVDIEPEPGAVVCRWCIDRSAGMLEKDPDCGWKRPE